MTLRPPITDRQPALPEGPEAKHTAARKARRLMRLRRLGLLARPASIRPPRVLL